MPIALAIQPYPGALRGLLGGDEGRRGARRASSSCRHVPTALAACGREGETPTAPRVKKPKGSAIGYAQAAARRGENRNPGPNRGGTGEPGFTRRIQGTSRNCT